MTDRRELLTQELCKGVAGNHAEPLEKASRVASRPRGLVDQRFQNPWDGIRNARLKREDAFSHAMIIVSSAMVSSS